MLDEDYYKRIEAIQFTMTHDDGKKNEDISKADIILLGVSRTSKTPTSIYLLIGVLKHLIFHWFWIKKFQTF